MVNTGEEKHIELPLKLILTETGTSALMRQKLKISRLKMGDHSDEYGLFMDKVSPLSLQRMIQADYFSKIEVAGVEPVESRQSIIELSKVIVFSILYGNYAAASLEQALGSEPVKKWNHANPSQVIDEKKQFREGFFENFFQGHRDEIGEIKANLLDPVYKNIDNDNTLLPDEKEGRKEIVQTFLSLVNPLVWFVLLKFHSSPTDFFYLLRNLRQCLAEHLKKSNIAEYTALMLMELASNIENLNILREAKLLYKTNRVHIKQVLQDPQLRLPVIEELRKKNSLLTFTWKLGGTGAAIGKRGKFQIMLYDKDEHYKETRESLDATKAADATGYNLSEYYRQLQKNGNELELGMFYLSFLSEACENMGIKFEAVVNQTQYTGQTITILSFGL